MPSASFLAFVPFLLFLLRLLESLPKTESYGVAGGTVRVTPDRPSVVLTVRA